MDDILGRYWAIPAMALGFGALLYLNALLAFTRDQRRLAKPPSPPA